DHAEIEEQRERGHSLFLRPIIDVDAVRVKRRKIAELVSVPALEGSLLRLGGRRRFSVAWLRLGLRRWFFFAGGFLFLCRRRLAHRGDPARVARPVTDGASKGRVGKRSGQQNGNQGCEQDPHATGNDSIEG